MTRNELAKRIKEEKKEAQTAGLIHRRDLYKHIKRMERELRDYDRFQAMARGDALLRKANLQSG